VSESEGLAAEKQKHATTQSLLTDYIAQLKDKEAENAKLIEGKTSADKEIATTLGDLEKKLAEKDQEREDTL